MSIGVALILISKLDLNTYLPTSHQILGRSLSRAADNLPLSEIAHQLACLAAFKESSLKDSIPPLNLYHAGFLIAANERDMIEILEIAAMPFVLTETISRGIDAVIISGSLAQWRDAVKVGCKASREVRLVFNSVYRILCEKGLKDIFDNLQVSEQQDHTFLLEG